ncbi:hypothetical protein PRZ48_014456 [Zasmidium cellare]|uniref:Methyltransferase type 11 domain-containing protein n=1 Tax=Zasmidium cellare TaxID=395010 RepID=A0ABR0DZ12_ZASCE|nr:hypothetical protein PRZ48_014456 [Zasmidium cellare]
MAQNIYDDPKFFDEYAKMERSVDGLAAAPEWPSLRSMVGDVKDMRVLDLGCGYGWFCRWAIEAGARTVHGVDISQRMIDKATSDAVPTNLTYEVADLDIFEIRRDSYDVVYSSLAFHYLQDLHRLFNQIHDTLPSGGRFVFSVEHPIFTAPSSQTWQKSEQHELIWPLNNYFREGMRDYQWLGSSVRKCHRTIETYIRTLARCRFALVDLEEFKPSDEDLKVHSDWANARHRPMFLLISARKL